MRIEIPEVCLVVLMGASGSGKSTFARNHFAPTEIVSSDSCRGLVDDDEGSLDATTDAFELVHFIARKRLARGRLTVIDATNVQSNARKPLVEIANDTYSQILALVVDTPEHVCHERNKSRPDRQFGSHVVRNHVRDLRRSLSGLRREGIRTFHVIKPDDEVEIVRKKLWNDRRDESGPFDVIGDVHGCLQELQELLAKLGYAEGSHPHGRKAVFVGDLVDRGPSSVGVLRLVMKMCANGSAFCVPGNHDNKLARYLAGKNVTVSHGLETTIAELEQESEEFRQEVRVFLDSLVSHYVLDQGRLVVCHAGCRGEMHGRAHARVRDFCLYGETTGETDEFGLPVRYAWAEDYRGSARVVYGHTPVPEPEWLNRTVNIDTGCVFGGHLTALRYPELELVSVPAAAVHAEPIRPIGSGPDRSAQHEHDDVLDMADVSGRMYVETRLSGRVTVREENAMAALEVVSRFSADPKWLVYLPPTMSPSASSDREGFLEYPSEAFQYYFSQGVTKVVCEQKHMGSRAVVVVCRKAETAQARFGLPEPSMGVVLTRTGRRFFDGPDLELELLRRVSHAAEPLFNELKSDWLVLDCELMPWSAKAVDLLRRQYAPTGAAALASTAAVVGILDQVNARGVELPEGHWSSRHENAIKFVAAYREYCWPVTSLEDYRLAPFHLMASEGVVHTDKNHVWHMENLTSLCDGDPVLVKTPYRVLDLTDADEMEATCHWWEDMVSSGGEGMVVKPFEFVVRNEHGLVQPAVKCRGPEYLRIIYGPDYLEPDNLRRLRKRGLGAKRSLAAREFALGLEGLERFVRREPLRSVHQCAFAVLALESEPVDPRL